MRKSPESSFTRYFASSGGRLGQGLSQQFGLGIFPARGAQAGEQVFSLRQRTTGSISGFCFAENFEGHVATVAPTRITRAQALGRNSSGLAQSLAQNAAADIGGARVAHGECLAGKITRGASQILVIELRKILAQQGGLFEFLCGGCYGLGRSGEVFERVWWNVRSPHCSGDLIACFTVI